MKNKVLLMVICFILYMAYLLYASDNSTKYPVNVESDSVKYFGKENYSLFTGNVKVTYKDSKIFCDTMKLIINKDNKTIDRIFCYGNVKFIREDIYGLSKEAEMLVKDEVAYLRGDVKVWQDQNYLEGSEVIIYNKENRVVVNKSESKRVRVIYYPDNKSDNKSEGSSSGSKDKGTQKNIQEKNGSR